MLARILQGTKVDIGPARDLGARTGVRSLSDITLRPGAVTLPQYEMALREAVAPLPSPAIRGMRTTSQMPGMRRPTNIESNPGETSDPHSPTKRPCKTPPPKRPRPGTRPPDPPPPG